jgi:hypothetical protein
VQCLWKTTSTIGEPKLSLSIISDPLLPEQTAILKYSNVTYLAGDTFSLSCRLPPKFSLISVSVQLPEG